MAVSIIESAPFDTKEEGILPLRLLEPLSSLNLTPFAAKAVRSIGATTVGDLAGYVFDPAKECRALGQGHLEEIRRKIEQFVGSPPYAREYHFDVASSVRLSLSDVELSERAALVMLFRLQQVAPLSPQESREAEAFLLKDKERKLQGILEKARVRGTEKTLDLLDRIFCGLLQPWIVRRGGIAHEREISQFLFERCPPFPPLEISRSSASTPHELSHPTPPATGRAPFEFDLFERSLFLLTLITGHNFLFSQHLCHVAGKLWAVSPQAKAQAEAVISDAQTLIGSGKRNTTSLHGLAKAVEKCRFSQWDACTEAGIQRLLFWHYYEQ